MYKKSEKIFWNKLFYHPIPSVINWAKWLTWALIFTSCSSSIFWVSLSFLVKLVFSSSRCLINFLCSFSFTMKKIKNNKYHIFIFTPISTPLKSLNHIFVDHSYEKITWFLGSPNYLHILQFHTYNKAYWSSVRWFWFVLYRPLIFRLFSFSLLSMNSCSSRSCLCWSTRSICNLVKFSMSTGLPERVPRWWEFWERNLARSLVASSNC